MTVEYLFSPNEAQLSDSEAFAGALISDAHQELMYTHLAKLLKYMSCGVIFRIKYAKPLQVQRKGETYNIPVYFDSNKLLVCKWFFELPEEYQFSFLKGIFMFRSRQ